MTYSQSGEIAELWQLEAALLDWHWEVYDECEEG
jgi:hypothetical protein